MAIPPYQQQAATSSSHVLDSIIPLEKIEGVFEDLDPSNPSESQTSSSVAVTSKYVIGAGKIAKILTVNGVSRIETIVEAKGIDKVVQDLANNNITFLNLSNSHILNWLYDGKPEVSCRFAVLALALRSNISLTSLNLSGNYLYGQDLERLAPVLKVNTSLTSLDLSENYTSPRTYAILADALVSNPTLRSLAVRGTNTMTCDGNDGAQILGRSAHVQHELDIA